MAKWVHADVLDNGPAYIQANCDKVAVIDAYTAGDSYATVNAAILGEATVDSGDFALSTSGSNRLLTFAGGVSDDAANATGDGANNHLVFLDTGASKVLWVTTETSVQDITIGNPINFPSLTYTAQQPT